MFSVRNCLLVRTRTLYVSALLVVGLAGGGYPALAALQDEPLRLSLNPPSPKNGEICLEHPSDNEHAASSERPSSGKPNSGKPGSGRPDSGRPGMGSRPVQESEHRPVPMRKYHFTDHRRLADVKAYVRRPDGSVIEPEIHLGVNPGLSFQTPMGDGPNHGAHNVYVVEQDVDDNTFTVRTAKWITMHHNCGWGHDGKFDKTLINPQPLETIPFEIDISDLWDPNFHASVTSGNQLNIRVLSYGKPVPGAEVVLSTEKGWSKKMVTDEHGVASMQLIRDYYPVSWDKFHRTHRGNFMVTARYEVDQSGSYKNKPYERIRYITTLPWKYSPSSQDYSSYTFGLLIAALSMTVSGVGVYAYRERRKKPYKRVTFDE